MHKCTHSNKHGVQCGNEACRLGLCLYHQPEEILLRLKHRRETLADQLVWIDAEIESQKNIKK